ncbi:XdhC family protein [Garciella nitratireducens]|uniref:Xanthine dehydrogenase accessory factor n=1 Tax=Garciella nitratireducens DSM 15102 TaxID=1121911 RepID=A0A1T4NBE3_9FIRM|nr:XdhC/CoxI family protein [Garciella nitratireducens]SJZ76544.1 xanthine dehydrogenase accessory factor [Garciella nitratireducens DSM 15102]
MNFYESIQYLDKNKDNRILTILTGKYKGEKLILSEGKVLYNSNDKIHWEYVLDALLDQKTQMLTIQGEKIFIEYLGKNYKVVICGAGHVALSTISLCKLLDLPVTVIDDRPSFTNKAIEVGADNIICESFESALDKIPGDKSTFFVIVTRGHRFDQLCLEKILKKESAYVGMMGSKVRVRRIFKELEEKGIAKEKLDQIYSPIGLKIGAETPAEIAVSIAAQIIEIKQKIKGSSSYDAEILNAILGDKYRKIPKALVTIVSRKGSAPRKVGTKMMVLSDGSIIGTVGGGCVEANLRQKALECISKQSFELVQEDMTGTQEEEGMVCGGIIEAFIEPIPFFE